MKIHSPIVRLIRFGLDDVFQWVVEIGGKFLWMVKGLSFQRLSWWVTSEEYVPSVFMDCGCWCCLLGSFKVKFEVFHCAKSSRLRTGWQNCGPGFPSRMLCDLITFCFSWTLLSSSGKWEHWTRVLYMVLSSSLVLQLCFAKQTQSNTCVLWGLVLQLLSQTWGLFARHGPFAEYLPLTTPCSL